MDNLATDMAQSRTKGWKKNNIINIGTWNIRSWNARDQEILLEMEKAKIAICALSETKKKGKGMCQYGKYILIYSGCSVHERAKEGGGVVLTREHMENLIDLKYVSARILLVKLEMHDLPLNLISIYAPEANKPLHERQKFYDDLQETINQIDKKEKIIVAGDFNARVGRNIIPGIKQRFNEDSINENGEMMVDFCNDNELRINNTFFDHKYQHKYTWENTRGHKSMIDYISSNRIIHHS